MTTSTASFVVSTVPTESAAVEPTVVVSAAATAVLSFAVLSSALMALRLALALSVLSCHGSGRSSLLHPPAPQLDEPGARVAARLRARRPRTERPLAQRPLAQ